MGKKLFSFLLTIVLVLSLLPTTAVFAEETESKTLTVGSSEDVDYATIQAAINSIYGKEDPTGWTITVESGTYAPFAVPKEVTDLTVQAADGATVTIKTWDSGYMNTDYVSSYYRTDGYGEAFYGVYVQAQNLTVDGINFVIGTAGSAWYKSGIHDAGSYGDCISTGLSVSNCTFSKDESVTSQTQGILNCSSRLTVTNCTFDDLTFAVYMCGDNVCADEVVITNNRFTDCENACVIYFGASLTDGANGTVTFSGNTVIGSADEYSSVAIEDLNDQNGITKVVIENNTFVYAVVGLVAVPSDAYDSLSANNNCDEYSIGIYTAISSLGANNVEFKFLSPSEGEGYWVFDETVFYNKTSIYQDSEAAAEAIQAAIDEANENNSRTLTVTLDMSGYPKQLIENNCILWVSGDSSGKTSYPDLTKTLEDGSESGTAAAGDTIGFELTSTVPESLQDYIEYIAAEPSLAEDEDEETTAASYVLTFHDVMDAALYLNESSFAVTVGGEAIDSSYYSVATSGLEDGCTFEVTIDLLALYTAGIISEEDFGVTSIVVSYSATLSESASAGIYTNTAWVVYPEGQSKEDQVEVDTYGITIFKYDQSTATTDEDGNFTAEGLAGAIFGLYADEDCTELIATLTSGEDGYVTYEGLDAGTYYLKETEAPDGYVMSETALTISIPGNADAETNLVTANFANYPIPHTGGAGTTRNLVGGALIIVLAGVIFAVSRRRKPNA